MSTRSREDLEPEIREAARDACRNRARDLNPAEQQRLLDELMDEVFGLGPLESLMQDDSIADILLRSTDYRRSALLWAHRTDNWVLEGDAAYHLPLGDFGASG